MKITGHAARAKRRAMPRASKPAAEDFQQLVSEFVDEALGLAPGEASPTARFADDFGMDSFDLLELAVEAQERFGGEICDKALAKVVTVGDFGRCVIEAREGCPPLQDSALP